MNTLISTVITCAFISTFTYLVGIPIEFKGSAIGLQVCVITGGIKKYKSIIKKKKQKHDKIVLLAKSRLNGKELINFLGFNCLKYFS